MAPTRCPACRAETAPDSDFCRACGAYLAWEVFPGATSPPADATPTAVLSPPGTALLLVRAAGDAPAALDALRVAAGGRLALTATVRNESPIADRFTVAVEGLPASWVELRDPEPYLLPVGAHGDFERDVAIAIGPPRTSEATAGAWPFAITVGSASRAVEDARVSALLTIEPFAALALDARPPIALGRRGAAFACELRNLGNAEATVELLAADAAHACWFDLPAPARVQPGDATRASVRVRPARTLWAGRPTDHRVQLEARTTGAAAKAALVYRQRPWVAWWVLPLVVLLAGAAVALWLAFPHRVTMPALIGARSAFAAQQQLARAGVRSHPQVVVAVRPRVAAGTVVDQAPAAGSRIPATAPVTLAVAAAPSATTVPNLKGLDPAHADRLLARVHLTLGNVAPRLDPKARIASQLPPPGLRRPRGSAVAVVLAPRMTRVPNLGGHSLPAAEKLLHRAGLTLGSVTPRLRPHARIGSQLPIAGTRLTRGAGVDVVLAQRTVVVPDLSGMTLQAADMALQICRLRLGPLSPDVQPGQQVASQVPASGSRQAVGTSVTAILEPAPQAQAPSTPSSPPASTPAPPLPTPAECALR